jgi:uncharacterized repeat protein (TIGR03803 family)
VFELTKNGGQWNKTTLHTFDPYAIAGDGAFPSGGLTLDAAGNLYGSTSSGGDLTCKNSVYGRTPGCGTLFKLSPQGGGWTETILNTFENAGGGGPMGPPILDSSGNLFGTTLFGGQHGYGTVFEIPAVHPSLAGKESR